MVARNRMVISGGMGSPEVERWSVTLNFTLDGGGAVTSPTDLQTWANNAADFLDAADVEQASISAIMSTLVDADRVDIYAYGPTGGALAVAGADCAMSGTGAVESPFQVAVCVSLLTDRPGASYRGRMYWPACGASVNSNGTYSEAPQLAPDFAELLVGLGNIDGTSTAILGVYSPTANVVTPVTSVRVGNVLDTQRRRRDQVPESYTSAAIIP